ncbi:hypothetical protein FRC01_002753 [Tulasnella sp. 417]|nr:hypothetical protein FRC01_002753 [Tulasnella sp. 417]
MLTYRLGDYMSFTFTGTGLQVFGTVGVKRGLIEFALDGQNTTVKDRTNQVLLCDYVLYEVRGLPYQEHTVTATLIGKDVNLSSDVIDSVLSIQSIQFVFSYPNAFSRATYYTPSGGSTNGRDDNHSGGLTKIGVIAGCVVGGIIALVAAGVGAWWCLRRKDKQNQDPRRASAVGNTDSNNVLGHLQGKAGLDAKASPGPIATPFEWNASGLQFGNTPSVNHLSPPGGVTPTTESGTLVSTPPPTSNNSRPPSSYFQPASSIAGRTNTYSMSSISDVTRYSNLVGTPGVGGPLGYTVTHPDSPKTIMTSPRTSVYPGSDQRASTVIDETQLVDRIVNRLADLITTRTGEVGDHDQIAPQPMYTGPGGPEGPTSPPQQQ